MKAAKNLWDQLLCRGVAVATFVTITIMETVFVLLFFGAIDLFTVLGLLAFLRVLMLITLFNAVLFIFAMRYQASRGTTARLCQGQCRNLKIQWREK